jgi:outer membrane protein assembly factor BamB
VRGSGVEGPVETRTDARGRATFERAVRRAVARAPRYGTGQSTVRLGRATVEIYRAALQSPQYGGNPERTRFVPAVAAAPPRPRQRPDWVFDAVTLIEFPPAVKDGLAVLGTNSGRVFALDVDTGGVVWETRQKGYIAATPAIAGDTAYVASMDGMLSAYRLSDGRARWRFSTGGSPVETSPLVVGDTVYVGTWSGRLFAIDARRGRLRWSAGVPGAIKGSAALAGDRVVVGDYAGNVHAFGARTGAKRWTYTGGRRFYGGPGVSGDTVVIGDVGGAVVALDAATGAQRWRASTGGSYVYSSPAIAGGRVFIGSYNGRFQALDLRTGAVRWSFDAGGRISGSATVVRDTVYVSVLYRPGEPRRTFGLNVRTGAVRYRGDDGRYSPAVAAGKTLLLVGTRLLYAFKDPAA